MVPAGWRLSNYITAKRIFPHAYRVRTIRRCRPEGGEGGREGGWNGDPLLGIIYFNRSFLIRTDGWPNIYLMCASSSPTSSAEVAEAAAVGTNIVIRRRKGKINETPAQKLSVFLTRLLLHTVTTTLLDFWRESKGYEDEIPPSHAEKLTRGRNSLAPFKNNKYKTLISKGPLAIGVTLKEFPLEFQPSSSSLSG